MEGLIYSDVRNFVILTLGSIVLTTSSWGCKKNKPGHIVHKIKYTTNQSAFEERRAGNDSTYQQFGNFITSITPRKFTAKLNIMNYMDHWDLMGTNTHLISYLNDLDTHEISQFADFSNNMETSLEASMNSSDFKDGVFQQKVVTFKYFNLSVFYFYQELELPVQYLNITLNQFNSYYTEWIKPHYPGTQYNCDTIKIGTLLKSRHAPFTNVLFNNNYMHIFVFGNCDSTFIFNKNKEQISQSPDFPFGGSTRDMFIRSNKFKAVNLTMPDAGQTITLGSTIVFDTRNLIQIYTGPDLLPYTSDDVFVYAPRFWERIKVQLSSN